MEKDKIDEYFKQFGEVSQFFVQYVGLVWCALIGSLSMVYLN